MVYMATLPLDANVQFMTVMATKMPYMGPGERPAIGARCPHHTHPCRGRRICYASEATIIAGASHRGVQQTSDSGRHSHWLTPVAQQHVPDGQHSPFAQHSVPSGQQGGTPSGPMQTC